MKKMIRVKRIMAVLTGAVLFAAAFTGCSKKAEIDPVKVMQAVMDAELKGDVDEYVKLSGEEKEDVLEEYDELLDDFAEGLAQEFEAVGAIIADQNELKDLAKKMLASAKYEVRDAEKDEDDNYTVNIAIYPSDLIGATMQTAVKMILENPEGGADFGTELGNLIIDAFNEGIEKQTYGEEVVYPVRLIHDEDYQYEPDRGDLEAIGSGLYTIPEELVVASGKDYGNTYLNWLKEDWQTASDDEKMNCCLAMMQKMFGFSDEQMAMIDKADPALQEGTQMMMVGIEEMYDGGLNLSVGDFTEYMMSLGMDFTE
ncbi:hypothetical protein [Mediterraneibacter agrestimuris]|uniref:hypothetical protein n=1 Tax=Mediterraneibacter agrestimuris TaxID=2941333 RepID=UPI0020405D4E|nr:hypothetical protein [Mediterraneibacter agrestimuris]